MFYVSTKFLSNFRETDEWYKEEKDRQTDWLIDWLIDWLTEIHKPILHIKCYLITS
jgi:hypothetical protein